jgi:hypothetical protein
MSVGTIIVKTLASLSGLILTGIAIKAMVRGRKGSEIELKEAEGIAFIAVALGSSVLWGIWQS